MSMPMTGTEKFPDDGKDPRRDGALLARRRRARSVAIGLALGALVILFYLITIAKLGPGVMSRPL